MDVDAPVFGINLFHHARGAALDILRTPAQHLFDDGDAVPGSDLGGICRTRKVILTCGFYWLDDRMRGGAPRHYVLTPAAVSKCVQ
jgi:hypothetical protein